MSKSRNYSCTLNNWTQEEYDCILKLDTVYTIIGKEVGEQSHIPHLHFQLCYKNPVSFESLKKKIPRARIEQTKDVKAYIEYSKKAGDYYEQGTCPVGQGKRTDLENVRDQIKEGKKMKEIIETTKNYQAIKSAEVLLKYMEKPRRWKTRVLWFYGPTGTGKSYHAREVLKHEGYQDWYESMDTGKWFEGYDGDEAVIVDDVREDFMKYNSMLKFLDEYGYRVETKGGSRQFLAKILIITSPFHPNVLYANIGEDIKQLTRRIEAIYYFDYNQKPALDMAHQQLLRSLTREARREAQDA